MSRTYNAIDSDAHVLEPGDLWEKYLEVKYSNRAPGLITRPDGKEIFRVEDNVYLDLSERQEEAFAMAGGLGMREGIKPSSNSYLSGKPGGFDPHKRIPDMDAEGIDAAFLFPSLGLFLGGMQDTQLAAAACRAYNRWLVDYCAPYPDRLFGVAMIPLQSTADAVKEIAFAATELGMRAGFIRPNPYLNRPLHHPDNDPVWQAAQDHDFSIAVHGSASKTMTRLGEDRFTSGSAVIQCTSHALEMQAAVVSFVMCGICDRFPRLRVGFLEAGGGWIAGWLDRMDRFFDDKGMNDTGLTTRPSEIFRRQCFISFEPVEKSLPLLADFIGRGNILWATDYPHADGFTNAPGLLRELHMAPELLKDIMVLGAKRYYGLT
ncbi:MAG: amidohydrolase [Betaproteobacteria bacterium]|nr:amidohydrolase [Betaproteobacteria bacterium]